MAVEEAKRLLSMNPLFLDTETTGLKWYDEIVELCILDTDGTVLVNSLVKPKVPITKGAGDVHGISDTDLLEAPSFNDLLPEVRQQLSERTVVIYNATFDVSLIHQSARAHGIVTNLITDPHCAMLLYAEFAGEWSDYFSDFRWHKLIDAATRCGINTPPQFHRARADAELTRQLIEYMAKY